MFKVVFSFSQTIGSLFDFTRMPAYRIHFVFHLFHTDLICFKNSLIFVSRYATAGIKSLVRTISTVSIAPNNLPTLNSPSFILLHFTLLNIDCAILFLPFLDVSFMFFITALTFICLRDRRVYLFFFVAIRSFSTSHFV